MTDDPHNSDYTPEEEITPEHSSDSYTNGTTKVAADRKVIAKFLISNAAAGSIIGKGGATISEFQEQSSARIQLSRNNEFFPGTADRVLSVSGPVNQVLTALHLIVGKVKSEEAVADSLLSRDGKSTQLRLLVPAALCGTLIGKAGATIKSFHEDSHAIIMVSPQDRQPAGVPDRVVKITGELEHIMRAVALILSRLSSNPNYDRFTSERTSYFQQHNPQGNSAPLLAPALSPSGSPSKNMPATIPLSPGSRAGESEVTLPVPGNRVGAIIGKGGEVINQLKLVVGVRIRVSDREDLVPGTQNRKVTISGPTECVQIAQILINQKISAASGSAA